MDFHLSEDLTAVRDLAAQILGDLATTERVRQVEEHEHGVDGQLWSALGDAGLLGLAVAEEHGGAGMAEQALEACCVVLTEQGRRVAPVPLWPHVVGALAVQTYGTPAQQQALLPGCATGERRVTVALEEFDGQDPRTPACRAERAGDGRWTLTGQKAVVPAPQGADRVLLAATGPDGPGLFSLETAGLDWETVRTTTHDRAGTLTLHDTPAELLGAGRPEVLPQVIRWGQLALGALQVGVTSGAMRLAADYTSEREQFGRPLGSFQAVQHQLADCWIDVDAMQLTLWQALQSLQDPPTAEEADRAALVAKWWCDQAGLDVVHRTQHVHGGMGVDIDYPVHRHFLWGKQVANTLGGAEAALADLGDLLAAASPTAPTEGASATPAPGAARTEVLS